jgi:hypothetical protein
MNWEAIGAVGEVTGAIAVVLTLIYLALQIRQNNRSLTGATLTAITQHQQNELRWSSDIGQSYLKALNSPESMTEIEQLELSEWLTAAMLARQNEYFQYKYRLLLEETWVACRKIIEYCLNSAWSRNWWDAYGRDAMSADFAEQVDDILSESSFVFSNAWANVSRKNSTNA